MSEKSKGTLCGIVAAVSYGMNPLGALSLYRAGINTNSVLFYRYALAAVLLAALLLVQKTSLRITRREFSVLGLLGVMFAVSSLTLFMSFHYMDAGIASTLLFRLSGHGGRHHGDFLQGANFAGHGPLHFPGSVRNRVAVPG